MMGEPGIELMLRRIEEDDAGWLPVDGGLALRIPVAATAPAILSEDFVFVVVKVLMVSEGMEALAAVMTADEL